MLMHVALLCIIVQESRFVALVKSKLSGSPQFDVLKASEDKKAAKPAAPKLSVRDRMMQMRKQQMGKQRSGDDSEIVVAVPGPPPPSS